jgi:hypothetical protein
MWVHAFFTLMMLLWIAVGGVMLWIDGGLWR